MGSTRYLNGFRICCLSLIFGMLNHRAVQINHFALSGYCSISSNEFEWFSFCVWFVDSCPMLFARSHRSNVNHEILFLFGFETRDSGSDAILSKERHFRFRFDGPQWLTTFKKAQVNWILNLTDTIPRYGQRRPCAVHVSRDTTYNYIHVHSMWISTSELVTNWSKAIQ